MKEYTVPVAKAEELTKKLNRIAKKAEKYGMPFEFVIGTEKFAVTVKVNEIDERGIEHTVDTAMVECVNVSVDTNVLVKNGEWSVIAKIERLTEGKNTVKMLLEEEANADWFGLTSLHCDHCHTKHDRTKVYAVRNNADGEVRLVGVNCLMDYTGISPEFAVMCANVHDILLQEDVHEEGYVFSHEQAVYGASEMFALAKKIYAEQGYIRTCEYNSNKELVWARANGRLQHCIGIHTNRAMRFIALVCDWLRTVIRNCYIG